MALGTIDTPMIDGNGNVSAIGKIAPACQRKSLASLRCCRPSYVSSVGAVVNVL
jgi:hypothetical protein